MFTLVLNKTDFRHQNGEIVLLDEEDERAFQEYYTCLEEQGWFLDTDSKPRGNLTAYFEKFEYPKGEGQSHSRS